MTKRGNTGLPAKYAAVYFVWRNNFHADFGPKVSVGLRRRWKLRYKAADAEAA